MNIIECPSCGVVTFYKVPNRCPAYAKVQCEACEEWMWIKLSRVEPEAWTVAEFDRAFRVVDGVLERRAGDNEQGDG